MAQHSIASDFDQISTVYDETRDPLDAATMDGIADTLVKSEVRSLLEIGVGTGRVASPLSSHGFAVTGIDLSRGMLRRAQAKGVQRLVRGSGYHLPFLDRVFDGTLFVHVLHIVDDPEAAIQEGGRVSRHGVFALVHPRPDAAGPSAERGQDEAQRLVREVLTEQGFSVPTRRSSPWVKEREIMAAIPPISVDIVSEADVTETLQSRLDRLERRGHRPLLSVPPEALRRAISVARQRAGNREFTYHRVGALAHWMPHP